ncbi:ScpA family protein [Candidatus Sororendozoicomonas aggregata]|uniref:segregation and condensation protein A n=1 Tax=Candidatus Sororendozoicomonas aggregata TaxID=3073239 RepID=UPI002ED1C671
MNTTETVENPPVVTAPESSQQPIAQFRGEALTKLPDDLYIPPEALQVFLEAFEGPLDLLLYLIKRNNMDILDIQVAKITQQYIDYVELMQSHQFELAAEYLVMAATLAEIKSRILLPRSEEVEEDEDDDPRAELIRRLQEYEQFKTAAETLDELPRMGRDLHNVRADAPEYEKERPLPDVALKEILLAMGEVLRRVDQHESHQVEEEALSVRERMSDVLSLLSSERFTPFVALYNVEEGRLGVVVTFMAIMELIKESLIELVQTEAFGPIHVKARID